MRAEDLPQSRGTTEQLGNKPNIHVGRRVQIGLCAVVVGVLAVGAGVGAGEVIRDRGATAALLAQLLTTTVVAIVAGYLSDPLASALGRRLHHSNEDDRSP